MPITDEQVLRLNPWWTDATAIDRDPKLRVLEQRRLRWRPPLLDAVDLAPGRVHTLRGPRQVGKSTSAKQLMRRLLERGERRVLYFSFDLSTERADIVRVIERSRQLHPDPDGPWYVFLDEVTLIPDWQLGVKYVIDNGPGDGDFMLCTGSSARKVGGEQLPGRRGKGRHYLQLPLSFRDFCVAAQGISLPTGTLLPGEVLTGEGRRLVKEAYLRWPDLERAWLAYLRVGGFPAAVEDFLSTGEVRDSTVEMLWEIVAGDVRSLGRSDVSTLKALERVGRSLGSSLSWASLAEDMDVDRSTARGYVELLAESFVLLTVFLWDTSGRGLSPRKQRKVYFIDPLVGSVAPHLVPGSRPPSDDAVREALAAVGIFRSATERLSQAEPLPGSLCFWKSGRGTEIDFLVAETGPDGSALRLPIEVKGDSAAEISNARRSMASAFGRGIVLTKSRVDLEHDIPAIPAPVFLAILKERSERKPVSF